MRPIDRPPELKSYYQDRQVAKIYMERRTAQPLNGLLHDRQVEFLNRAIAQRGPGRVLEIACGPGRLTAAVRGVRSGVAIDSSLAMLDTASHRMNGAAGDWLFMRTDAFRLPFQDASFDAVYTLRFVRHFQLDDRERLYGEIRRVLRPDGVFMVDALNRDVSLPHREARGLERYPIYDELYRLDELHSELRKAGFRVVSVEGILKHFAIQQPLNRLRRIKLAAVARLLIRVLERIPGNNPSTWMLLCDKHV